MGLLAVVRAAAEVREVPSRGPNAAVRLDHVLVLRRYDVREVGVELGDFDVVLHLPLLLHQLLAIHRCLLLRVDLFQGLRHGRRCSRFL